MKKTGRIFVAILTLAVVGGVVYYFYNHQKLKPGNSALDEDKIIYPETQTPKPDEEIIKNWQSYSDSSKIFSLKYPDTLQLNALSKSQAGKYLNVAVEKISDLGTGAGIAEQTKEALENGKLGPEVAGAIKNSQRITDLDNGRVTSEQYLVAATDNCQVSIFRELIFFWGESQVKITDLLVEPENLLSDEFLNFDSACNKKIWADTAAFYKKSPPTNSPAKFRTGTVTLTRSSNQSRFYKNSCTSFVGAF